MNWAGHGQLHPQRVDAHHRRHLGAARDVVAHRHQPLGHHAREGRAHHGVGHGLARQGQPRAGAGQRLPLLLGAVAGGLVLPLRVVGLRLPRVVLGLRHQLAFVQHAGALEVGARQVTAGAGRRHLGHPIDVEVTRLRLAQARLNLRHVGVGFLGLRLRLVGGHAHQRAAGRHLRAALHRRADDAALRFRPRPRPAPRRPACPRRSGSARSVPARRARFPRARRAGLRFGRRRRPPSRCLRTQPRRARALPRARPR